MHTKMPVNLVFVINFIAPNKLVNASDEGLSDDRCEPTKTTGIGKFCNAKLIAEDV
jgi:hypothetical protein